MNTSFDKIYFDDNIYCVENFLSEEEINYVLGMNINWKNDRNDINQNILIGLVSENDLEYFKQNIENKIHLVVDNDNQKFRSTNMLTKYIPNSHKCLTGECKCDGYDLSWHYENHPGCDYESRWITQGIVLYFNEDYEGGELVFEHKPVKIKPKRGSLMVFPATEEYSHAVKKVFNNERIVYSGFVYSKEYWDILNRSGLIHPLFIF